MEAERDKGREWTHADRSGGAVGGAFLSAEILATVGREGWWKRGKHPIVLADSELGRTGVFKSPRPFNSTLLTAGCLLLHNAYPDTQTRASREHKTLAK